jgi:hypothetical protein
MFNAVLFTIAKLWKQLQFCTTDERINKMWYLYSMDIFQPFRRIKHFHLQVNGWNWKAYYNATYAKFRKKQCSERHVLSLTCGR